MNTIFNNILILSDSYKVTHWPQYPQGTDTVTSYLESRGGMFKETLVIGLNYILKTYLTGQVVTEEKIQKAKKFWDAHLGPGHFNESGWRYILEKYDGYLPVTIKAVPEGTVVPTGNVLVYIHNNGGEPTRWLTNYLESILLQVWYPITVGTLSREIKKVFIKYLKKTTDYNKEQITGIVNFMLHDFGFRGVSSVESSGIGGLAHLVNFRGTDTATAILLAQEIYNTDEMLAFSIPASEHSTITSWGEENEVKAYENMLDAYPTGTRACVSDSYNILRACEELWGGKLREKVLNLNGRLVIRPDSGDPVQTLKKVFHILWDKFGGRTNSKGFKVLDDHVRVIQGDGVNYESIIEILDMMVEEGFSAENIVFGMGGALLQKVDRDTQKFAFKCCSITINGEERDVQKHPLEVDKYGNIIQSFKTSKKGHLKLVKTANGFETIQNCKDDEGDVMVKVFENGHLLVDYTFDEIRQRAEIQFDVEEPEMA
jgi:nicotinamide phosphoribosyltransferase